MHLAKINYKRLAKGNFMAVKLRMTRMGRRHKPFFRIVAIDSREPRDGRIIEKLGHYDPLVKDPAKQIVLKRERIEYWLTAGAIPSATVAQLLEKQGIKNKIAVQIKVRRDKARAIARKRGVPFTKAERDALQKKAEAEAAAAGEQKPAT